MKLFHTIRCDSCYGRRTWEAPYMSFSGGCIGHPPTFSLCGECANQLVHQMWHKGWHQNFIWDNLVAISSLPKKELNKEQGIVQLCRLYGFCDSEKPHWVTYNLIR